MSGETPEIPQDVLGYLQERPTMTLATVSRSGIPHAATLVYANDGVTFYFCTKPETVIAQNIGHNPTVSFAVDEYHPDWSKIRGVQGTGEAEALPASPEIEEIANLFRQKFPVLANANITTLAFFRVTPSFVQYIDNSKGGAQRPERTLSGEYDVRVIYDVFRDVPPHEVASVAEAIETVEAEPGDVIVEQGTPGDRFFIIARGEVEVIREDEGESLVVTRLQKGQYFGEMSILRNMPRTATVRATRPSTLLVFDREAFVRLLGHSDSTSQQFDEVVQRRLAELMALREPTSEG
jgi:uncharacterized protein YhbP (UPF0306 family)